LAWSFPTPLQILLIKATSSAVGAATSSSQRSRELSDILQVARLAH